jgi:peptidoglycan biosynthesis protein MviN/MurJ (putative lipid II flippase)
MQGLRHQHHGGWNSSSRHGVARSSVGKAWHPRWRWNPRHPDIQRVAVLVLPALWGLSIDQINAYVDTICASFLREGSVTALYNSNRLMQFALALFGVSLSTATLPHLVHERRPPGVGGV